MKRKVENPKPLTLEEYVLSELRGKDITLGTLTDGTWQETLKGEQWNAVMFGSMNDENPKIKTLNEFKREHACIVENFENRMAILGVF